MAHKSQHFSSKAQRLLFDALMETSATPVFVYQDDSFLRANCAAELFTGYSQEELSNKSMWDHHDKHVLSPKVGR